MRGNYQLGDSELQVRHPSSGEILLLGARVGKERDPTILLKSIGRIGLSQ